MTLARLTLVVAVVLGLGLDVAIEGWRQSRLRSDIKVLDGRLKEQSAAVTKSEIAFQVALRRTLWQVAPTSGPGSRGHVSGAPSSDLAYVKSADVGARR